MLDTITLILQGKVLRQAINYLTQGILAPDWLCFA